MNEESGESFIDLKEEVRVIDEEAAREMLAKMLIEQGLENKNEEKMQPMDRLFLSKLLL
ncbi:MAG: hypothetical protein QHH06_06015 [Clostridiales bacterium]|jgi:hypothetical protein|nr:hypothetical protein [Eubacteriales bacterium]MDH7566019.1 hypothetical protein [Clostridiales bacterium]